MQTLFRSLVLHPFSNCQYFVFEQAIRAADGAPQISEGVWTDGAKFKGPREAWQGISQNADQFNFTVLLPPEEEVDLLDGVLSTGTASVRTPIFAESVLLHVLDGHFTLDDFESKATEERCVTIKKHPSRLKKIGDCGSPSVPPEHTCFSSSGMHA